MIYHSASQNEVLQDLNSNRYQGLSKEEAQIRLERYGENLANAKTPVSFWGLLLNQFKSIPLAVVMITAVIWLLTGLFLDLGNPFSALAVLAIALISVAIGMIKQYASRKALSSLRGANMPMATVIRDGEEVRLPANLLVPGDILLISEGDYISADARLLSTTELRCDESSLTGEPVPVEKDGELRLPDITPIENRTNMVYAGCTVAHGSGVGVVTGTGSFSEQAKLSVVAEDVLDAPTPLQKHYKETTVNIGIAAAVVSALIFLLGLFLSDGAFFDRLANSFMTCAALAVAAVPQSLAATVTVVLAVGVRRMQKNNVAVRSLSTVETLGKVSAICTDKTGTLTQNRMTLTQVYNGKETVHLQKGVELSPLTKNLMLMGAMCCDGYVETQNGVDVPVGDHTEAGIVWAVETYAELDKDTLNSMYPRLCELPFDSTRRMKTSVNMVDGKPVAVVKGAPDSLIERCVGCDQKAAMEAAKAMAKQSLRVIGIAFKALPETPSNPTEEELEHDLVFGGLFGLTDPPMEGTQTAISDGENAGIKVIMMTGDHVSTAVSSAKDFGIMQEQSGVITDDEISSLTDEELADLVHHFTVYVRLSPENKVRVVTALQQKGYVVAITGDEASHAPVLKQADVGCAMGVSGTDVAKGAAHLTVTDDSFASIMGGINAGRGIYANVCKAIRFSLSFVLGLSLFMLVGLIGFGTMPFNAVQIMWLNLLVSAGSVLPLGLERPAKDLMHEPPRKKDLIFGQKGAKTSLFQGFLLAVVTFVAYLIGNRVDATLASTMAFATLGFGQVLSTFGVRSTDSFLDFKRHRINWWLILSAVVCSFSLWFVGTVPALVTVFGVKNLPTNLVWTMVILSLIPLVVVECTKLPNFVKSFKK